MEAHNYLDVGVEICNGDNEIIVNEKKWRPKLTFYLQTHL